MVIPAEPFCDRLSISGRGKGGGREGRERGKRKEEEKKGGKRKGEDMDDFLHFGI